MTPALSGEYVTVGHHGGCSGEYVTETVLARFARPRRPVPVIYVEGPPLKPRGKRKPSIATLIARAEKAGKIVTSITLPDGTMLRFGASDPDERNEWDEVLSHGPH